MRRGFTLVELLITVAIVAILAGLLLPMVAIARRGAEVTNTRALLRKVQAGLELFCADVGGYPHLDHGAGFPAPNRLARHLARDPSAAEAADLRADLAIAGGRYSPASPHGTQVLGPGQVEPRAAQQTHSFRMAHAARVNQMAAQRARTAVLCGHTAIAGFRAYGGYDFSGTALLPAPASAGHGADYLAGDILARELAGDAIVDRWGRPLLYVCTVVPGAQAMHVQTPLGAQVHMSETAPVVESPNAALAWNSYAGQAIEPPTYGLETRARAVTTVLASDVRDSAAAAFAVLPELWSGGPDRQAAPQRDDPANRDNIPAQPYLRGLR